ncbi:MAG: hypothetical protein FJZ38_16605 [Candidatus Rokubacteria bacterium]|nr:hypothetical protein [Candidatus Rokubacteria bacterium]
MTLLRRAWEGWKRVGRKVGDVQARVLLTIFYFVILAPFGLGVRAADPLGLRRRGDGWRVRPPAPSDDPLIRARRQA